LGGKEKEGGERLVQNTLIVRVFTSSAVYGIGRIQCLVAVLGHHHCTSSPSSTKKSSGGQYSFNPRHSVNRFTLNSTLRDQNY